MSIKLTKTVVLSADSGVISMPTYIFRLHLTRAYRLSQTPYVSEDGTKSFCMNVPGFGVLAVFDETVSLVICRFRGAS